MTDHLYLALISHLPNFTKCSKETFVFCQFFSFIRISFGACHFLSLFFAVVFLSLLAENHRCFVCVWMCLQLHFKTNSLQPEFNSKKKNRTRLRQIFRFHVVTSLFRMFTVAHCMFLSRFLFRWYMLFYSHRSCFAQKPFSLWFQVLFIFGFGVCLQPKSFLSLDFYLFICLLLLRFFFH